MKCVSTGSALSQTYSRYDYSSGNSELLEKPCRYSALFLETALFSVWRRSSETIDAIVQFDFGE